jgi:hypothetical protein
MVCPICHGQGLVFLARIKATGRDILICDECDSVWHSAGDVNSAAAVDFDTYMRSLGRIGLWSELTILDRDPPPDPPAGAGLARRSAATIVGTRRARAGHCEQYAGSFERLAPVIEAYADASQAWRGKRSANHRFLRSPPLDGEG